jgi:hypothetical protein
MAMNLEDFVKESLAQIFRGVLGAARAGSPSSGFSA